MAPEDRDVFDRIMSCPVLKAFEPFYRKNKAILLYIFFGGLAFVVSVGSYSFLEVTLGVNELIANIVSWILAVLFAFITNRTWVFDGKTKSRKEFTKQIVSFFEGRVFTLIVEEVILLIFVTWLGFNSVLVKVIAQIIVIICNYFISKLWVFSR